MQNHFLQEIKIIDYKCFKKFSAKNFKRVNLISGKNNVGKTAFMEALYINLSSFELSTMANTIPSISFRRNNLEYLAERYYDRDRISNLEKFKSFNIESNINKGRFQLYTKEGIKEYHFFINSNEIKINANDFSFENKYKNNTEFIDNFGLTNTELKENYVSLQKKEKEDILDLYIREFDHTITKFKFLGGENPSCKTVYSDDYREINDFGDGLKHYISIICALYASENGYLFIDEIDNGIHYTQLEKLWEIIFTISEEVNCQVFATTHSKEMINAFAKVSKKFNNEDISFIELGRNKNNEIKSITMDYEKFQREISSGNEIRGW